VGVKNCPGDVKEHRMELSKKNNNIVKESKAKCDDFDYSMESKAKEY
jgi:hypothetical protein